MNILERLALLPRSFLVATVILGVVFMLLILDPPYSVCRVQVETFKKNQDELLFKKTKNLETSSEDQTDVSLGSQENKTNKAGKDLSQKFKDKKNKKTSEVNGKISILALECEKHKTVGACYLWFEQIKVLLANLDLAEPECLKDVYSAQKKGASAKKHIGKAIEVMAALAWGTEPPVSQNKKRGWLDLSSLDVFCSLKKIYIVQQGSKQWDKMVAKTVEQFPGAERLNEKEGFSRSLFSENCGGF